MKEIFEWSRVLMNDLPYSFLVEVLFRCFVMFSMVLLTLRTAGRRGIKQLSIFELVVIITLGSAAGDPMFYDNVGLLPAICVLISVLSLYRIITWAISKHKKFENWIEGKPLYLIKEGEFSIANFKKESLAIDEFFSELRLRNVDHLGQVKLAILESSGDISVFFYPDDEVKPGLPILPHEFNIRSNEVQQPGLYACSFCGLVKEITLPNEEKCHKCNHQVWLKPRNNKRVT